MSRPLYSHVAMLQDGASACVFWETNYVAACRFQIEYNKVQFWSKIKLAIANRTPASRSCDFVITRLISDQIALYSVQLSLSIRLPVGRSGAINSPVSVFYCPRRKFVGLPLMGDTAGFPLHCYTSFKPIL